VFTQPFISFTQIGDQIAKPGRIDINLDLFLTWNPLDKFLPFPSIPVKTTLLFSPISPELHPLPVRPDCMAGDSLFYTTGFSFDRIFCLKKFYGLAYNQ
jgi:hypothetical protein